MKDLEARAEIGIVSAAWMNRTGTALIELALATPGATSRPSTARWSLERR